MHLAKVTDGSEGPSLPLNEVRTLLDGFNRSVRCAVLMDTSAEVSPGMELDSIRESRRWPWAANHVDRATRRIGPWEGDQDLPSRHIVFSARHIARTAHHVDWLARHIGPRERHQDLSAAYARS